MHKCRGHQDGRTGAGLSLRDVAKLHSFLHTNLTYLKGQYHKIKQLILRRKEGKES